MGASDRTAGAVTRVAVGQGFGVSVTSSEARPDAPGCPAPRAAPLPTAGHRGDIDQVQAGLGVAST